MTARVLRALGELVVIVGIVGLLWLWMALASVQPA